MSKDKEINDAASLMPDLTGKNILMGFWHNWASEPGQGYQQGIFKEMALTEIPEQYNVVAVAFMKGVGIPTFQPYNMSDEEFRRQVGVLNAQGRAVLISLGGADAHIELKSGQEDALAQEIIRLVETYGFDGLDIDLEQSAITLADNQTVIPNALRQVKTHYAKQDKNFIISMAPEFPYLNASGKYLPYIKSLSDIYDFIAPQFYNQGGDGVYVDGLGWLAQDNDALKEEFLFYLTDSLVNGTRGFTRIPADRFVIGLPSNIDAAATGYVKNPQQAINALQRLEQIGQPIRGLMTWSVNWDNGVNKNQQPYNWEFVTRYGYLTDTSNRPSAPANLQANNITETSVELHWDAVINRDDIEYYTIYRNDISHAQVAGSVTRFLDTELTPNTKFSYFVIATTQEGYHSLPSNSIHIKTLGDGEAEPPEAPVNLQSIYTTKNSITLQWSEPEKAEAIQQYNILRDGDAVGATGKFELTFVDEDLTPDTEYSYTVTATDENDQTSAESNKIKVKTKAEDGSEVPEWAIGESYEKNDKVSYSNKIYYCIQAHRAIAEWSPEKTLNILWGEVK